MNKRERENERGLEGGREDPRTEGVPTYCVARFLPVTRSPERSRLCTIPFIHCSLTFTIRYTATPHHPLPVISRYASPSPRLPTPPFLLRIRMFLLVILFPALSSSPRFLFLFSILLFLILLFFSLFLSFHTGSFSYLQSRGKHICILYRSTAVERVLYMSSSGYSCSKCLYETRENAYL